MNDPRGGSRLRRLARDYAEGRIDRSSYVRARTQFLDALGAMRTHLEASADAGDPPAAPAAVPRKGRLTWVLIALAGGVLALGAIGAVLLLGGGESGSPPAPEPETAAALTPAPQPAPAIPAPPPPEPALAGLVNDTGASDTGPDDPDSAPPAVADAPAVGQEQPDRQDAADNGSAATVPSQATPDGGQPPLQAAPEAIPDPRPARPAADQPSNQGLPGALPGVSTRPRSSPDAGDSGGPNDDRAATPAGRTAPAPAPASEAEPGVAPATPVAPTPEPESPEEPEPAPEPAAGSSPAPLAMVLTERAADDRCARRARAAAAEPTYRCADRFIGSSSPGPTLVVVPAEIPFAVTVKQYDAAQLRQWCERFSRQCVTAHGKTPVHDGERLRAFADSLSQRTGRVYRPATPLDWLRAADYGIGPPYPQRSGERLVRELALPTAAEDAAALQLWWQHHHRPPR